MSSPRISARGAGARSRARAKRPKAVPCAVRTAAHGSPGRSLGPRAGATRRRAWSEEHSDEGASTAAARTPGRRGSASASDAASAGPTLQLKNGLARLSPATTPGRGAQLASTADACGGAFARAVARPCSDRAARAPHDHGGVGLTPLGRRARRSERSAKRRRCPGGARGRRAAERSASCQPAPAQWSPLGCGALHGARQEEGRGGASGARRARARTFLAPRAGADGGAFRSTAPAGAVRAPLRAGSSWTRTTRSRRARGAGARRGRRRRGRVRKGAAFGSGRRGGRAAALHGSRRRGPPPLAVTAP